VLHHDAVAREGPVDPVLRNPARSHLHGVGLLRQIQGHGWSRAYPVHRRPSLARRNRRSSSARSAGPMVAWRSGGSLRHDGRGNVPLPDVRRHAGPRLAPRGDIAVLDQAIEV
jgi:hypothetical protein